MKKAIRQAGRQEGPRNEIRHGRSHRHVGIQTKKIRSMRWSGRKAGRIGRGKNTWHLDKRQAGRPEGWSAGTQAGRRDGRLVCRKAGQ